MYIPGSFALAISVALLVPRCISAPSGFFETVQLAARQDAVAEGLKLIGEAILHLAVELVDKLKDINGNQHNQESAWTQSMVTNLRNQFPTKSVAIYHDMDSTLNAVNLACTHYELNLVDGPQTEGYQICLFDSGTFHKVGDGGYLNWCVGGNFDRSGDDVTFYTIDPPEQAPPAPPAVQPVPPPNPVRGNPSDTDGNYFVNCQAADGTVSSGIAYYKNLSPSYNVGQQPDDYVDAIHGSYVNWGTSASVTFPSTGVTVTWNILGDSENAARDTSVGTADNGYENFWVYRGSNDLLYTIDDWQCTAIYWMF